MPIPSNGAPHVDQPANQLEIRVLGLPVAASVCQDGILVDVERRPRVKSLHFLEPLHHAVLSHDLDELRQLPQLVRQPESPC